MSSSDPILGPILFLDDIRDGKMHLAALLIAPMGQKVPPVIVGDAPAEMVKLAEPAGKSIHRARFSVSLDQPSFYHWNGTDYALAGVPDGAGRLAFVSCNGEEHGDLDRDATERNAMWARLAAEHDEHPFSLILHGGDQVYADEATRGHPLSEDWPDRLPRDPSRADLASLRDHLRERFAERYITLYQAPEFAYIAARVPALMQWDDHDICDGWGSLQRSRTYSPVGQTLFEIAREAALLFQHGTVEGDLPARFRDPAGLHLGWSVSAPGLRILGPDLRSERTRREVMGKGGWQMMEDETRAASPGRTLVLSSVPLLGPRLSLLELLMVLTPRMQKYEDDLRDQWQSRAHRDSWLHMLELMARIADRADQQVTVLSGEIHLATRGEMSLPSGDTLHQLVASGISHRAPPKAWAKVLGALAMLGDSPLKGHSIRMARIPGQTQRYIAERNYLVLERKGEDWSAEWDFEAAGRSPALSL
ncbi:alkaline phosphatase D family protein [Nioella aestuarii]|uniref:alkaline phosphatase D family protein n=1 Tax=Nioella aestuarii TaxID=1662864 RepID=UPI003D7F911F